MAPKRKQKTMSTTTTTDFSKMAVAELKIECKQRSLNTVGKKAELLKRLDDYEKNLSGKKIKTEDDGDDDDEKEAPIGEQSMKEKLKELAEEEKLNKTKRFKMDSHCPISSAQVVGDYDCMLNQTNVSGNNNKFYVIQLLQCGNYFVWNRWGRVGEVGQNALKGPFKDLSEAEKEFKKKFKDKTKNTWDDRENFSPKNGKYTMIEIEAADSQDIQQMEEKIATLDSVDGAQSTTTKPCTLDDPTQSLIKLIFDNDMFKEAMESFNIDVKKMPLGKLSKFQIAKGFEVLEEIEESLNKNQSKNITELTSTFYTLIPHNFGRNRPPLLNSLEAVKQKMDMLLVLSDIVIAQTIQKSRIKKEQVEVPHPLDINFGLLNCDLKHIDSSSNTYKFIETYVEKTKSYGSPKILDIWEVDRQDEDVRFSDHKDITHRKLLWHGTNVAVVVAILKSGLRIMPHSGGRVGRGIYFASEHGKSAAYVGTTNKGIGIMFLNEVALGKQHVIRSDNSSLTKAPAGFDSVLAQGTQEPDPSKEIKIVLDGNEVIVPQGKPIKTEASSSSFSQSEYLVYTESQCRIRYLIKFKMH